MINPLNQSVFECLSQTTQPISEYDLLQAVRSHPALQALEGAGDLALFQRHFFLMNSLYQLQDQLLAAGTHYLSISALHIHLQPLRETGESEVGDAAAGKLRNYYLDWQHFEAASEAGVRDLLRDFWQRYTRYHRGDEALAILELPADATPAQIKTRYRQLAAQHHPDRGGDRERFVAIRQAYEALIHA